MNRKVLAGLVITIMVAFGLKATAADWEIDYAKAAATASKAGQYMLLDFSGSDWCGWCMKLDKEVFSKTDFKNYAKENLVRVLVDFPHGKPQSKKVKEQNAELAKKYDIEGYPTVIVLSPSGALVGRTGYQEGGAKQYVEHLQAMIDKYEKKHPKPVSEKKSPARKSAAGDNK